MTKKIQQKRKPQGMILSLLLLCTITTLALCSVYASNTNVYIGETRVPFTAQTGFPFTDDNGRMQVPLRSTMESYGCQVTWDDVAQEALLTKEDITVTVPLGKAHILVNGVEKTTDTTALMQKGRVYLPIRPVLEAFGATLTWDGTKNAIFIRPLHDETTETLQAPENALNVHFIDVGQGDAILIDNGTYEVLIDGGNNKDGDTVVTYLKDYVDGDLELIIGTHADADHIGGLDDVLKAYDVKTVIDSGQTKETKTYTDYWNAVTTEANCQVLYDEDTTINLGGDVRLDIIETGDNYKDTNDNSVVAKLIYKDISVLLTGDMEEEAETAALAKLGSATVLKSGHHGSATSSSEAMLAQVKPQYVVISAGKDNAYRHPHANVLKRYEAIGATTYGTFRSGSIVMTTDGKTLSFNTNDPVQLSDAGDNEKAS